MTNQGFGVYIQYIPFLDPWKTVSDTSGTMGVFVSRFLEHLSPDFVDPNSHHSGMASSPFAKLSDFLARQIPADPQPDWHTSIVGPWEFQDPKKEAGYDLVGLYFVRIFPETKALHRPYRSFLDTVISASGDAHSLTAPFPGAGKRRVAGRSGGASTHLVFDE